MKTYLLSIADEPTDRAVRAALADFLDQCLVTLEADDDDNYDAPPVLTEAAIEDDILQAQQQPGVSLVSLVSAGPLPMTVTPVFMDRLFELEQYFGRVSAARGRQFVSGLFDFVYTVFGPYPLAFPTYQLANYPALELRRAVFQERCNLILVYEITPSEVKFLTVFSAAHDAANVRL